MFTTYVKSYFLASATFQNLPLRKHVSELIYLSAVNCLVFAATVTAFFCPLTYAG